MKYALQQIKIEWVVCAISEALNFTANTLDRFGTVIAFYIL